MPFEERGFNSYYNQYLSDDFEIALLNLKGNLSLNYPVIIITWYDDVAAMNEDVSHARVVTGYDSNGIFVHDPFSGDKYSGRNVYFENSLFSKLWNTDFGFWAFIVRQEPFFNLRVNISDRFGFPIAGTNVELIGRTNQKTVTNGDGVARFNNIPMGKYEIISSWRFEKRNKSFYLIEDLNLEFNNFI
ncbi:unnamed protein product, partial [marine sediment metagenome]